MINEADNISSRDTMLLVLFEVILPDLSYRKNMNLSIFPPLSNQKRSSTAELNKIVAGHCVSCTTSSQPQENDSYRY
jgi:hypothetical protein